MLAGLLAAVMVISLAACGNKQSDGTATQSNGAKVRQNRSYSDGMRSTATVTARPKARKRSKPSWRRFPAAQ